ncbi:MAG: hypothetical protein HUJ68_10755 [Clostridia bacterium]|nr:hypothetical protein [Clostridia bacterium]
MDKQTIIEELKKFPSKDILLMMAEATGKTVEEVSAEWNNLLKEQGNNFPAKDITSILSSQKPLFSGHFNGGNSPDDENAEENIKEAIDFNHDNNITYYVYDIGDKDILDHNNYHNWTLREDDLQEKTAPIGTRVEDVFNFSNKRILFGVDIKTGGEDEYSTKDFPYYSKNEILDAYRYIDDLYTDQCGSTFTEEDAKKCLIKDYSVFLVGNKI